MLFGRKKKLFSNVIGLLSTSHDMHIAKRRRSKNSDSDDEQLSSDKITSSESSDTDKETSAGNLFLRKMRIISHQKYSIFMTLIKVYQKMFKPHTTNVNTFWIQN